jgi:hypothetical protein
MWPIMSPQRQVFSDICQDLSFFEISHGNRCKAKRRRYLGTCTSQPKVSDRSAKALARRSYSHFRPKRLVFSQDTKMIMQQEPIQNDLLVTLLGCYEENPEQFLTLPKQTVDSSSARVMVAELRNEGIVEEQVRGVIRLTPRGYSVFKSSRQRSA